MNTKREAVRSRQNPLMKHYETAPERALVTDIAWTTGVSPDDPFHGEVVPDKHTGAPIAFGIHERLGGLHDGPTAGDILCAALACCIDSTIRMVAGRFGVELLELEVRVEGDVDVRGTLMVDADVPVAFQEFRTQCRLVAAEGTDRALLDRLMIAAEHCCVVLQTLRQGVPITSTFDTQVSASAGARAT